MRKINEKGFTFIEMLMVFAVISILVLMFIPSVHRMREKGRQATCITNQRQLAVAALLYANECRDFLPLSLVQLEKSEYIIQTIDINQRNNIIEGSAFAQDINMGDFYRNNIKLLQCPESEGNVSYGLNVMVAGLRIDLVPNASRTVLLADSHFEAISSYVGEDNEAYVEAVEFRHGATWDNGYAISIAAYVDGHIEVFKQSDFDIIDGSDDDLDYSDDDYYDDGDGDGDDESYGNSPGSDREPNRHRRRYRRRKRNRERERAGEGEGEYNENEYENEYEGGDDNNDVDDDDDTNDGCDNGNNGNGNDKDKGNNGLGNGGEESQGEDTDKGEDPSNPAHGDDGKTNNGNGCGNDNDDTDDECDNNNNGNGNDKDKGNNGLGNGGEESQGEDTDKGEDPSNPAHGDDGSDDDDGKTNNGKGNNK